MPKAGSSASVSRRSTDAGDRRFVSGDVRFTDTAQRSAAATGDRRYTGPADRRYADSAEPGLSDAGERPLGDSAARGLTDTGEQRFPNAADRLTDTGERWLAGAAGPAPAAAGERHFTDTAERRLPDTAERGYVLSEAVRAAPAGAPSAERALPEPPRQSRAVTVGIVLLSIVVLVTGSIVGVVYFTGSDDKLDSVLQLGAGEARRTVSAPLDNRAKASFELLAATNKVSVRIGELGDDLYRISTPEDAGIAPDPEIRNDDVKLQVIRDGDGTGGEIDIVLAAKVRWTLRFSGYAEEQVVDLSGGQIGGIEMVGGMRRAEVTLPRPSGTVPIKVNGAVEQLTLKSPQGSPVRVRVGGGAKTVVAGTRTLKDIAAGSTLTPKGWAVPNRYDVGAGAPITSLTVQNA